MNFDNWTINESSNAAAKSMLSNIQEIVGDTYGKLYIVPDFETFERPGEPKQKSVLIGTSSGFSFAINYDGEKFYSIDTWNKDSENEPDHTIYADGSTLEQVLSALVNQSQKANEELSSKEEPLVLYVDEPTSKNVPKNVPKKKAAKKKLVVKSKPAPKTEFDKDAAKADVVPAINKNPDKDNPELKSKYEFQDPDTIFEDLKVYTNMVINGTQPSMLITGMPGVGKTYKVTQEMKKAGLVKNKDYIHAKGKATAAGMYQTLYQHNGKLIIFDDMDSIFKDDNAINVLKGALDSGDEREISWLSARPIKTPKGEIIPQSFDFTGRVIFISNMAQKDIDPAIKSRSFVIEVALTPDDMVSYIENLFDKIMPYERVSTKRYALDSIKDAAAENPAVKINMRTFIKAVKIVKNVKDKGVAQRMIVQQCSYK